MSRAWQVFWVKWQDGETQSFRFNGEEAPERVAALVAQGATLIPDPFRKGQGARAKTGATQ